MLQGPDVLGRLRQLLRERAAFYEGTAELIVDVDALSIAAAAQRIAEQLALPPR